MNNKEKVLLILIAVIILISWSNLQSSRELENRISQIQNEMYSLRSSITHEVGTVSGVVRQIQEEARWWSPGQTEILNAGKDEAQVKIDWYVKEYQENSLVTFNYRNVREKDFISLDADKGSDGYFFTVLSIEMIKAPLWELSISHSSNSYNHSYPMEEIEEFKEVKPADVNEYEYYISVTKDGTTRTGEVRRLYLHELSYSLFNPLYGHVSIDKGRPTFVNLVEGRAHENVYYRIKEAYVEARTGTSIIKKWPLAKDSNTEAPHYGYTETMYSATIETETDYDSFYIVVKYNDAITVEKRIR
ncbi:MAG: hypothetical protein NUK65_08675 [Firmicutes bacterium]|nr:hypothetical protein [Bacillota bacterium]